MYDHYDKKYNSNNCTNYKKLYMYCAIYFKKEFFFMLFMEKQGNDIFEFLIFS